MRQGLQQIIFVLAVMIVAASGASAHDEAASTAANPTEYTFSCGKHMNVVVTAPGKKVLGGRTTGATAKGSRCARIIQDKDKICEKVLGRDSAKAKEDARKEAQQYCENIVKAKVNQSYSVQCEESSRNSCENPDECSPTPLADNLCPLPELDGTEQRIAKVFPWEVAHWYEDEKECSLLCAWEFGVKATKVRVRLGCSPCDQEGFSFDDAILSME